MKKSHLHIDRDAVSKGRGAQFNVHNKFLAHRYEENDEAKMPWHLEEESDPKTQYIDVFPKQILSKNNSPDVPFEYSINPYNGCEHGCTYCYARNSHEYWGYSAGVDFEQKILIKKDAPRLLEEVFQSGKWTPQFIALSGNTDCYQPAERKFGITRKLLEVFLKYKHPVGIITKNALILRDLDILQELHKQHLLGLTLSITTLREDIRRVMEPRTSSVHQRLHALETLANAGFCVNVNMAPIVPGINSDEVFELVKTVGERGANSVNYIMVRLNGQIATLFEDWVYKAFPERADKIMNQIREAHGGQSNDSRFGTRMRGEGKYAQQVSDMFKIAKRKFIHKKTFPELDFSQFVRTSRGQMSLDF